MADILHTLNAFVSIALYSCAAGNLPRCDQGHVPLSLVCECENADFSITYVIPLRFSAFSLYRNQGNNF